MESGMTFERLATGFVFTQLASSTIHFINHKLYYPHESYWQFLFDELVVSLTIGYGFIFALLCLGVYRIKQQNKHFIYRECKDELIDSTRNNGCDCSSCEQSDDESDAESNEGSSSTDNQLQKETLSSRMKRYETESLDKNVIEGYESFIIRLDGRCFSKFTTKYFKKPFDDNFADIMLNTANSLFKEFHPTFIHVQSDEISLVFKNICTKEDNENEPKKYKHIFGGKVNKMISVISSYASGTFYRNLMKFVNSTTDETYNELKTNDIDVSFLARISVIPQDYEIINYTYWRSVIDGYCNTALMYARNMYDIQELNNMSPNKMIEKMKTNNFDFTKQSNHIKYGWILKNSQVMSFGDEKNNENSEDAYRYIPQACSFRIKYSTEIKELLLDPVWNDEYIDTIDVETETF